MVGIGGLGQVTAYKATARKAATARFSMAAETAEGADGPAATASVAAPLLLGLQEAQGDAVSDREARRHAGEALDTLRDMQLDLLRGGSGSDAGLAAVARRMPEAADPGLRLVQRALLLRVAVEKARHRAAASL